MASASSPEDDVAPDCDESTALLRAAGSDAVPANGGSDRATPAAADKTLPSGQIFFLCLARLIEPVAFFCIFPFLNQMIWDTGEVAKTDVGFYSGLIESLFSLTQMVLVIPWGRAADRWGRKPVLVTSLGGVAVATAIFGLSKAIWQMILFRCLAGAFAGTIVTIRTMISENSSPETQAQAFSYFSFTGSLGIFLGPLLGGALADPAHEYPRWFGWVTLFREYPYCLPTFVTGCLGAIATIVSAMQIKETLVKRSDAAKSPSAPGAMSTMELLRSEHVPIAVYIYSHVMLLAFAYTAIAPVFFFTPVDLGGFGFSPFQISLFLGLAGLSQALWLLLAFPWVQARIGTAGVLRLCANAYPFFFAVLPACNLLLRHHCTAAFWAIALPALAVGSGVSMSFTAVQLVLNDASPAPEVLGTLNAVALMFSSGIRAVAPALFASLFATSIRSRVWGGHVIWILMIALALGFTVASRFVPEKATLKKTVATDSHEE